MPVLNGIEAARQLTAAGSRAKIVFLTVHDDEDYVRARARRGRWVTSSSRGWPLIWLRRFEKRSKGGRSCRPQLSSRRIRIRIRIQIRRDRRGPNPTLEIRDRASPRSPRTRSSRLRRELERRKR